VRFERLEVEYFDPEDKARKKSGAGVQD